MQYLIILGLLIAIYEITKRLTAGSSIPSWFFQLLFLEHVAATAYYMYTLEGDWVMYFETGVAKAYQGESFEYVRHGTQFIVAICHLLNLDETTNLVGAFSIFSLCGYLGMVFFVLTCLPMIEQTGKWHWLYLFYLPGFHVWTCALGKDALIFLPLCYVLYAVTQRKFQIIPIAASLGLIFMIRPHVGFFLVAAAFCASMLSSVSQRMAAKIGSVIVTGAVVVLMLPTAQEYTGVEEATFEAASARMEFAATKNQKGGGAVDITQYSPPVRLATFMFRPLFLDVKNEMGLLASLENAFLLALFTTLLRRESLYYFFSMHRFDITFCAIFVLVMWTVFGMSLANLGLSLRQKTQFLPFIYFIILSFNAWRISSRAPHYSNMAFA